ncbi:hypothetical protein, partial [Acinetobacter baumannii]
SCFAFSFLVILFSSYQVIIEAPPGRASVMLLPGLFYLSDTSQLVIRLLDGCQQWVNPQNSLAICQRSGGSGTITGWV